MATTLSTDGYCEAADVQALCQSLTISTTSNPTTAEVEGFIKQDFGLIGGMLAGVGYVHPVSQAAGSLAVSAGTIVTVSALVVGATSAQFVGSGGTITGIVRRGDFFRLDSGAQRYQITSWSEVDSDSNIWVGFTPKLEKDHAAAATVTYTAATGAADILKRLNALRSAVQTLRAAYGSVGSSVGDDVTEYAAEAKELFTDIKAANIILLGADRVEEGRVVGSVSLRRA